MEQIKDSFKVVLMIVLAFGFGWTASAYRIYDGLYSAMTNNVMITKERK